MASSFAAHFGMALARDWVYEQERQSDDNQDCRHDPKEQADAKQGMRGLRDVGHVAKPVRIQPTAASARASEILVARPQTP